MRESFPNKPIRCQHCEFEFSFSELGNAAKIVCPACGEAILPSSAASESPPERSEPLPPVPVKEAVLCSVEHCPLLTGNESGNPIARQIGLRLHRQNRRRTILAWTVTLQVCVLFGTVLFLAKTLLTPETTPTTPAPPPEVVDVDVQPVQTPDAIIPPTLAAQVPPEPIPPLPPVEEERAWVFPPLPEPEVPSLPPYTTDFPFEEGLGTFPIPPIEPPSSIPETGINVAIEPPFEQPPVLPLPTEPKTLEDADALLASAELTLTTNPEGSVEQTMRAAKIYEEWGEPFPESMYWILGNAFASLSWGEPLLESSPAVETMTLCPAGRYLLAQLRDKSVWLWDLHSPANERAGYLLDSGTEEYVQFVFTPGWRWIIGGQKNGTIRIWDMSLPKPAEMIMTLGERIVDLQDLQISPNGQWLAAFGNTPGGVVLAKDQNASQDIRQVNYQHDRFGVYDSSSYPVLVWNLHQLEAGVVPVAMPVSSMPQPVQVIRFSPNSDRLAIGCKDAIAWVYDLSVRGVGDDPFVLRGHLLGVTQIAFAPSGQWMATGSKDNTVRLWNLTSSRFSPESATLYGHLGWISALTIDSTGEHIVSGSYDQTIRIWHVKRDRIGTAVTGEPIVLETNLGVVESLSITDDGDKVIALGNEGSLGIYHLPVLWSDDSLEHCRAITFRNSQLSISKSLVTADDQLLIFSYEHLLNPLNSGIRLWSLRAGTFMQ